MLLVQVAAHRLVVVEPGLGDDVLAVVRLELLDRGLAVTLARSIARCASIAAASRINSSGSNSSPV
jgi:hypothetical protein